MISSSAAPNRLPVREYGYFEVRSGAAATKGATRTLANTQHEVLSFLATNGVFAEILSVNSFRVSLQRPAGFVGMLPEQRYDHVTIGWGRRGVTWWECSRIAEDSASIDKYLRADDYAYTLARALVQRAGDIVAGEVIGKASPSRNAFYEIQAQIREHLATHANTEMPYRPVLQAIAGEPTWSEKISRVWGALWSRVRSP